MCSKKSCRQWIKENWRYWAEGIAIAGMAIPIGMLSAHIREFGIKLAFPSRSWETITNDISSYWNISNTGILLELVMFFAFLIAYSIIRGHSDIVMQKGLGGIKKTLEDRLPTKNKINC